MLCFFFCYFDSLRVGWSELKMIEEVFFISITNQLTLVQFTLHAFHFNFLIFVCSFRFSCPRIDRNKLLWAKDKLSNKFASFTLSRSSTEKSICHRIDGIRRVKTAAACCKLRKLQILSHFANQLNLWH